MPHYDAALTLRDARGRYFAANGLGERGYQDAWGAAPLWLVAWAICAHFW
jgi:hypothetical protein